MTAFEDRILAVALNNIEKYGKTITIQQAGTKTYDPATGSNSGSDPASFDRKALIADFSSRIQPLPIGLKSGDKQITLAASGISALTIGDKFTVDSNTYTVVPASEGGAEIATVYAGEVAALYKVHGRKS